MTVSAHVGVSRSALATAMALCLGSAAAAQAGPGVGASTRSGAGAAAPPGVQDPAAAPATLPPPRSSGASAPREGATGGGTQLGEVIVTAQRRETSLQRTPEAVSVLNGVVQRDRGEQGLSDLRTTVPNVNFAATSNTSQLYIRGVGNTFINAGGDPGVAFYQDNAYVSDQTSTNTSQFDVDRIEVLRGPQGALYGRNAVGGAVNVLSNKPLPDFHFGVDGVVGDYGRRESEGYVTGPLGFADTDFRVSYQVRDFDGYTRNLLAGRSSTADPSFTRFQPAAQGSAPDRFDDLSSRAVRIQTLTHLPGDGSLNLLFSYYTDSENGQALAVKPYNGQVYPAQALFGLVPNSDPRVTQANFGFTNLDVYTLNLNYTQPIGDYTLSATGDYRSSVQSFINDCDATSARACSYYRHTSSEDWYGDIHFASPSGNRFRWLAGATVLRFNQSQANLVDWLSLASYFVPGVPTNVPFPINSTSGGRVDTKSYAAYLDLHYKLTQIFSLTGQVRYSTTTKGATEFAIFDSLGVNVTGFHNSLRTVSTPYKLGVEAQFTSNVLVYADYATAEKDGAINIGALQTAPVRPEDVRTEELGAKTSFFSKRLRVNGAIFNSDYDDLQISQLVGVVVALANAPTANIKGVELEVAAIPIEGLQLSLNGGYLDATFGRFSNSATLPGLIGGPLLNLKGNKLPYVAPYSLNFDVSYKAPSIHGFTPTVDAQYSLHGRTYFNEFNTRENSQGAVGLLNVSASISPDEGRWKVYAYIHNLTNETIATGATIYAGILGAERGVSYDAPRNFGIGAAYRF